MPTAHSEERDQAEELYASVTATLHARAADRQPDMPRSGDAPYAGCEILAAVYDMAPESEVMAVVADAIASGALGAARYAYVFEYLATVGTVDSRYFALFHQATQGTWPENICACILRNRAGAYHCNQTQKLDYALQHGAATPPNLAEYAAQAGDTDLVVRLCHHQLAQGIRPYVDHVGTIAARNGHFHTALLCAGLYTGLPADLCFPGQDTVVNTAAAAGHLAFVASAVDTGAFPATPDGAAYASANGHLHILKWWVARGLGWDRAHCIKWGRPGVVAWIQENTHGPP